MPGTEPPLEETLVKEKVPPTLFKLTADPVVASTLIELVVIPLAPEPAVRPVFPPLEMSNPLALSLLLKVRVPPTVGRFEPLPEMTVSRIDGKVDAGADEIHVRRQRRRRGSCCCL